MGYQESLEAAGAEVLEFKEFGSYQGSWYALVNYNGEKGWIEGSYGSCSGCDAFQAEFGWNCDNNGCDLHRYRPEENCEECQAVNSRYTDKLKEFGKGYLSTLMSQDQIEKYAAENSSWSYEDLEALEWVKTFRDKDESDPLIRTHTQIINELGNKIDIFVSRIGENMVKLNMVGTTSEAEWDVTRDEALALCETILKSLK